MRGVPVTRMEEVRMACGGSLLTGQWEFPPGTPPYPLAVLLPPGPGWTRHGPTEEQQGSFPLRELSLVLIKSELAVFSADAPHDESSLENSLEVVWGRALDHGLVSRARLVPVALGAGCGPACRVLPSLRRRREPMGVLLVAPAGPLDLRATAGLRVEILLAGKAPGPSAPDRMEDYGRQAAALGIRLRARVVEDATEHLVREEDWIAGRPVVHPGLLQAARQALVDLILPVWERPARPPGAAIG